MDLSCVLYTDEYKKKYQEDELGIILTDVFEQTLSALTRLQSKHSSDIDELYERINKLEADKEVLKYNDDDLLDLAQASRYTGLAPKTLRNQKSLGHLVGENRAGKKQGKVYFRVRELKKLKGKAGVIGEGNG